MARKEVSSSVRAMSKKSYVDFLKRASAHAKIVGSRSSISKKLDDLFNNISLILSSSLSPHEKSCQIRFIQSEIESYRKKLSDSDSDFKDSSKQLASSYGSKSAFEKMVKRQAKEVKTYREGVQDSELGDRLNSFKGGT